jgi:hypothetical protein
MRVRTVVLLVLASLFNATIGAGAFLVALFATSPSMQDVTMRIGFYVLHLLTAVAAIGVVGPWILVSHQRSRAAAVVALLPALLTLLAVVAFLTLDSWLRRTFAG